MTQVPDRSQGARLPHGADPSSIPPKRGFSSTFVATIMGGFRWGRTGADSRADWPSKSRLGRDATSRPRSPRTLTRSDRRGQWSVVSHHSGGRLERSLLTTDHRPLTTGLLDTRFHRVHDGRGPAGVV